MTGRLPKRNCRDCNAPTGRSRQAKRCYSCAEIFSGRNPERPAKCVARICIDCLKPTGRNPRAKRCDACSEASVKAQKLQEGRKFYKRHGARYYNRWAETRRSAAHRRRARLLDSSSVGVTATQWQQICAAYSNACAYCKRPCKLERDHFVPIARGGRDEPGNVVPACRSCNASKGAKLFEEWDRRAA